MPIRSDPLRLGGKRPGKETTRQSAKECAPVHHSITCRPLQQ